MQKVPRAKGTGKRKGKRRKKNIGKGSQRKTRDLTDLITAPAL